MPRKVVSTYRQNKRKSHPHSKNASVGKKGYKKKYKGQGRWKKHQVELVQQEKREAVYARTELTVVNAVMEVYKHKVLEL